MNFNGYSYGGYPANGYYTPPMPDQLAQLRGAQMQPQNGFQMPQQQPATTASVNEMIWVQGESAAKSYIIAPGNTVILWDSENPVIYIKSSDASGIPSMRILDYTERTGTTRIPLEGSQHVDMNNYATRDELEALAARVDALTSKPESKMRKTTTKENDL